MESKNDEHIRLVQITVTNDITTHIIKKCKKLLYKDETYKKIKEDGISFDSIKVYGTPEDPCFKSKDVYNGIVLVRNLSLNETIPIVDVT